MNKSNLKARNSGPTMSFDVCNGGQTAGPNVREDGNCVWKKKQQLPILVGWGAFRIKRRVWQ